MTRQASPPAGRAQTIVSTAPKAPQEKQRGTRRTKLLPNRERTQQRNAASPVLLGYARVSKAEDQDTAPQIEALHAAGCQRVYEERVSGGRWDRPELHRLLDRLEPGNVLTVW
jgi:resolvase-like protein